jgi:hypothetical protein
MKKSINVFLLFLFLSAFSIQAQKSASAIQGTWKLVSSIHGGKKEALKDLIKMKFITKSYFTWVSCTKENRIIRNSVGGTYVFDGQLYTETVDFVGVNSTQYLDRKHVFKVTLKGDKMYLSGILTGKQKAEEIWQRMDAK